MSVETDGEARPAVDVSAAIKAAAEAQAAETAAARAAAEFQEWQNAAGLRGLQDQAAATKARSDEATAERAKWADLVPEIDKVEFAETKVTGDHAIRGSALGLRSLKSAAHEVATLVRKERPSKAVLVTNDLDLAGGDAAYRAVTSCLDELLEAARQLAPTNPRAGRESMAAALAVGGLVAKVIPKLLQLASARRSVSTFATTADDLSSAVNVISALLAKDDEYPEGIHVVHDDFRIPQPGGIEQKLAELSAKRTEIALRADEIPDKKLTSFVAAVDAFLAAVAAVPAGGTRSALTNACLREGLHDGSVEYVLLVRGMAGSVTQLVNDRRMRDDKVTVIADASITYLLLRAEDARLVAGGTASGSATMHGTIGDELRVKP